MSNNKYPWGQIIEDMTALIAQSISDGKKPPTIHKLYDQLKGKYDTHGIAFPKNKEIFYRKIHKHLGMGHCRKNHESYFYQLAGQCDNMTIDNLAAGLRVSALYFDNNCNWLFIRVKQVIPDKSEKKAYKKKQKHLYLFAKELKRKFSKSIVFTSFDKDTLVILCIDEKARTKIEKYIKRVNNGSD